jgi:hypothetical protein
MKFSKLIAFLFLWPALVFSAYTPPATPAEIAAGQNVAKPAALSSTRQVLDQWLSTRTAAGYLWSDGATANRAQIQTPSARGNLAGAPVVSWAGWVDVPSTVVSCRIAGLASAASADSTSFAHSMTIGIGSDNALFVTARGVTPASDIRAFTWTSFRTTYSGQRIWLEVRVTKGTTNPVVRVNGVDISASFTPAATGTLPPEWLDSALITTNHLTGYNWPAGVAPLGQWLNAHLTDAESEAWRLTGRPPAWVALGGSMVSYYNGLNAASRATETNAVASLNTAGTVNGAWTSVAGARTGGSGSFYARWTSDNGGASSSNASLVLAAGVNRLGQRVGVRFWARASQPVTISTFIGENNSGSTEQISVNIGTDWQPIQRVNTNCLRLLNFTHPIGATVDIDDLEFIQIGALSLPAVQPTAIIDDASGIGGNPGRLVGLVPVTARKTFEHTGTASWTATHEAKSVFGGQPFRGNVLITDIITKSTAASTGSGLTVGNTASNSRYVAANTYTTAKKVHTLANRMPAATAANDLDIVVDPDTANYTGDITVTVRGEILEFTP